jgi:O-antigen/teichoic acid export membrane protein
VAAEASEQTPTALPAPRPKLLQRLRHQAIRRLSWGVADQIVSSLTNFAIGIYVIHALGAAEFGAFSLAYVTYGFALNLSRGVATDPLMVRFSGTDVPTWRRAVASCTGTAACAGLITGACAVAAAALLSGATAAAFLGLGLTLPMLLLQDSWRYSFIALGRGGQALLNDTIWAVSLAAGLVLLRQTHHPSVFWFVFTWGAAAAVGAAAGPIQARVMPRLDEAWKWVRDHRDLGPRYLAEGAANSAALQLRGYGVGLILGLASLGSVQAAATLFGPMTILFLGMSLVAIPEGARVVRRSPRHLPLFCLLVSAGLTAAAIAWGVVLLVMVPLGFGAWLLGSVWRSTYPLVLPQMLFVIGQGVGYGANIGLHALGVSRRSLNVAAIGGILYVGLALAGALVAGGPGTVLGAAIATWISTLYGWWQLRVAQRDAGHEWIRARTVAPAPRPTGRHVPQWADGPRLGRVLALIGLVALLAATLAAGWVIVRPVYPTASTTPRMATPYAPHISHARAKPRVPTSRAIRTLEPVSAITFDPYGGAGSPNGSAVSLSSDGDLVSTWQTQWYASALFGNLKPGTGLLLDMGRNVTFSSVRVSLGSEGGAALQIRTGRLGGTLEDLVPAASAADVSGQVTFRVTTTGRYVLIWFTELPPDDSGTYQAVIYGVRVTGRM